MKPAAIAFAFILFSCQQTKLINTGKAALVIGKWRVYETVEFQNNDDSVALKCNVCPAVEFFRNHSGLIKKADEKLLYFRWEVDNDELIIRYKDDGQTDKVIDNGSYKVAFNNVAIKEIRLTDTLKNIRYILSK
jgi:hypothetical protein